MTASDSSFQSIDSLGCSSKRPAATVRICCVLGASAVWGGLLLTTATVAAEEYLGPCALVAAKDGKTLYIACADARQVVWVELPGGQVIRRVDVPAEPTGIVLTPDGSKAVTRLSCSAATT